MPKTLTKRMVESKTFPESGQVFYRDNELPGFALRVTKGTKAFILEKRIQGKMRRVTLGIFPLMSVEDARIAALEKSAMIERGEDPVLEDQKRREVLIHEADEPTFGEMSDRYLEKHARREKKSWKADEGMIKNHLEGFRPRRISTITRREIIELHDRVGSDNGRYAANRLIMLLRTIFNLAKKWDIIPEFHPNPAAGIKLFPEEKRDRFLSPDELKKVIEAIREESDPYWRAYFMLSLFLGSRRNELLSAKWEQVDFEERLFQFPKTKSGRPHLLPIPRAAGEILKDLKSQNAYSPFIFPGVGKSGHLVEPKKPWHNILTRAHVKGVRIHDLRRTLGSFLAGEGFSLALIGRALNHTNVSTTSIYARFDVAPVREALQRNEKLMLKIADGKKARSRGR